MAQKKLEENVEALIESVNFIKDKMATKDDLEELDAKVDRIESKLGSFENSEIDKRKQIEVRVDRIEKKVGV